MNYSLVSSQTNDRETDLELLVSLLQCSTFFNIYLFVVYLMMLMAQIMYSIIK